MEEDVGEMKSRWIESPDLIVQPIRQRGERPVIRHEPTQLKALLIQSPGPTERCGQKILQELRAQDHGIFTDEIFVIPEKFSVHRREKNSERNGKQDQNINEGCFFILSHGVRKSPV